MSESEQVRVLVGERKTSELRVFSSRDILDEEEPETLNQVVQHPQHSEVIYKNKSNEVLSLAECRKLDIQKEYSDEELIKLRDKLYPIIEKILDQYFDKAID